ncbi:peptidase S8/S53 domain-containing protein [Lactarius quietus]|nr:peptidase S8/S53 domain-containing protein [Lactarius quietus]
MRIYCIFILSILTAVLLGSLAKPPSSSWDDKHTKHSWNAVPKNWKSLGRPPLSTTIDLYITLKPRSENALIDVLYNVSTPDHPEHVLHFIPHPWTHIYGEHLSREQVAELVAPHPRTLKLVNSWLKHNGIPSSSVTTQGGNTLMLKAVPVTKANILLDASYQLYRHFESHETIVRTVGYGLPAALHEHVRTVVPTTAFVPSLKQWQIPRNISGGETVAPVKSALGQPITMLSNRVDFAEVEPDTLRWMYRTALYRPIVPTRNSVGIVGAIGNFPSSADLTMFIWKYRREALTASFSITYVNLGPNDQLNAVPDVNIQYLEALVFPTPVVYYVTGRGPSGTDDWFNTWLRYLLSQESLPQTISGSFSFDEDTLPMEYAVEACQLFAQLSTRGVTFLFASGDDGVGEGDCVNSEGLLKFRTTFPATCPYVTAVGGTTGFGSGTAATFSGGGFSNYFERPRFQRGAVRDYLDKLGERNQGFYNAQGRGIPDLSAQAVGFKIVVNGEDRYSSSTGLSTAVVASVVGLLSDWRLFLYRGPRGWLNPWLYGRGRESLTDVKIGQNEGCSVAGLGFPALQGWDPVSGIGTPDFPDMKDKTAT